MKLVLWMMWTWKRLVLLSNGEVMVKGTSQLSPLLEPLCLDPRLGPRAVTFGVRKVAGVGGCPPDALTASAQGCRVPRSGGCGLNSAVRGALRMLSRPEPLLQLSPLREAALWGKNPGNSTESAIDGPGTLEQRQRSLILEPSIQADVEEVLAPSRL